MAAEENKNIKLAKGALEALDYLSNLAGDHKPASEKEEEKPESKTEDKNEETSKLSLTDSLEALKTIKGYLDKYKDIDNLLKKLSGGNKEISDKEQKQGLTEENLKNILNDISKLDKTVTNLSELESKFRTLDESTGGQLSKAVTSIGGIVENAMKELKNSPKSEGGENVLTEIDGDKA